MCREGTGQPEVPGQLAAELVLDPVRLPPAALLWASAFPGQVLTGVCPGGPGVLPQLLREGWAAGKCGGGCRLPRAWS